MCDDPRIRSIESYRAFAEGHDVPPKQFSDAERCVIAMQAIPCGAFNLMTRAFARMVKEDYSAARIASIVSEQGYPVEDLGEEGFSTVVAGRRVRVKVGDAAVGEPPAEGERSVVLSLSNVNWKGRVEYYPYLAAPMFSCLEPGAPRDRALRGPS